MALINFYPPNLIIEIQDPNPPIHPPGLLKKVNMVLSKPSAKVEVIKPKALRDGIPIEERKDFKNMFKDLDYSKLTEMDQAYIRNFYTKEMQKIEDKQNGVYKPKPMTPNKSKGMIKQAKAKAKEKVITFNLPTKIKAPVAPVEIKPKVAAKVAPTPVKKSKPKVTVGSDSETEETKTPSKNPLITNQKGFFSRMWEDVLNLSLIHI